MIKVQNLSYRYDTRKTDGISHINLEARAGEVISLLGPSGSGKTTTLKCIAGLISDFEGRVEIEKEQVVLYMDQQSNLDESKTIFEYLAGELKTSADELSKENQIRMTLASLELTNEINSSIKNLSAGQRQRVILAKNLIQNPTVLLLDEPFTNLDKSLRLQLFQDLLPLLKEKNITLIWVTHNQEEALRFSQKVILLNYGAIQQTGSPKELYFKPQNLFTAKFFGESNTFISKIVSVSDKEMIVNILDQEFTVPVSHRLQNRESSEVVACIRPACFEINKIEDKKVFSANVIEKYFLGLSQLVRCQLPQAKVWLTVDAHEEINIDQTIQFSLITDHIHFLSEV